MGSIINLSSSRLVGGKSLPYDAEIEYLESTGTQYINPNIYPSSNHVRVETKFTVSELRSYASAFGFLKYQDYSYYSFKVYRQSSNDEMIFQFIGDGGQKVGGYSLGSTYIIDAGLIGDTAYIDINGERKLTTTITENTIWTQYPILIFMEADSRNEGGARTSESSAIQLYYFKIYNSNGLVFDAIPVRVGQVGYLYDKVSGELFGNAGTGDFILGNDV